MNRSECITIATKGRVTLRHDGEFGELTISITNVRSPKGGSSITLDRQECLDLAEAIGVLFD